MRLSVDDDLQMLAAVTISGPELTDFERGAIWALGRVIGVDPIRLEARYRELNHPAPAAPAYPPIDGATTVAATAPAQPSAEITPVAPAVPPIGTAMGVGLPAAPHPDQVGYYPMLGPIVSFGEDQPEADLTKPPAAPVKGMADEWREAVAGPNPDPALLPMDDETLAEVEAEIAAASDRQYDPADPEIATLAAQAGVTLPPR